MIKQARTMIFEFEITTNLHDNGFFEIGNCVGKFKNTHVNRTPVRSVDAPGILSITPEGISFKSDERPDLLK